MRVCALMNVRLMKEIFVLRERSDHDVHNKSLEISGLQSVILYATHQGIYKMMYSNFF